MIRTFFGLATATMAGFLATATLSGAEIATATISGVENSPGEFQYSLTLNDTGTTGLGTFWFSWVPGDNFMSVKPTGITSAAGWQDVVTQGGPSGGYAIQWTAVAPADDLTAGNSLAGFGFESSLTLAQLESPSSGHPSDPVATAFVYGGAPFSDAGFKLTVEPAVANSPEPSTFILGTCGLGAFLLVRRRRPILWVDLFQLNTRARTDN
jgi:hypothetical protein